MNHKTITSKEKINNQQWLDFINNHKNGSIFQTPCFFDVCKNTPDYEPKIICITDKSKQEFIDTATLICQIIVFLAFATLAILIFVSIGTAILFLLIANELSKEY